MAVLSYHEQEMIENTKKLRKLIRELPPFCADFFRGIEPRTSSRTRIAYAYDLSIFFDFLIQTNPIWKNKDKRDFTVDVLDQIGVISVSVIVELGEYNVPYFHETVTVTSYFTVRFATAVFFSAVIVNLRTWTARTGTMLPEVITLSSFRIAVKSCDSLCRNSDFFCPDIECFIILTINGWIQSVLL